MVELVIAIFHMYDGRASNCHSSYVTPVIEDSRKTEFGML